MLKMLQKHRIQQMQQMHDTNVFQYKETTSVAAEYLKTLEQMPPKPSITSTIGLSTSVVGAPLNKIKTETDNCYWCGEGADMYPEEDSGGFDETCNLPNNIPEADYIPQQKDKDKDKSEVPQRAESCICRLRNSIVHVLQMLFKWRK